MIKVKVTAAGEGQGDFHRKKRRGLKDKVSLNFVPADLSSDSPELQQMRDRGGW